MNNIIKEDFYNMSIEVLKGYVQMFYQQHMYEEAAELNWNAERSTVCRKQYLEAQSILSRRLEIEGGAS